MRSRLGSFRIAFLLVTQYIEGDGHEITGASHLPLVEMMDTAYQRWLETRRQFYAAPMVSAPQVRGAA